MAIVSTGRVAVVNARAEAMFGYDRRDPIGQSIETLLPERLRDVHARHRLGYLAEPRTRPMGIGLELFGRRKDGTEFPVEIGLGFLKTGQTYLATSFVTHISADGQRRHCSAASESLKPWWRTRPMYLTARSWDCNPQPGVGCDPDTHLGASVKASQAFTPSGGGDFQERHNYEEPIHEI